MLETGFCDQIKSFYRCMIMWRAIRSWASLCGDRALHAEIGACSTFKSAATVGLANHALLRNTNNNRMRFKSACWRASFGQRVAIIISGFGCPHHHHTRTNLEVSDLLSASAIPDTNATILVSKMRVALVCPTRACIILLCNNSNKID
jgi:hypothetical protein